MKYKIGDIITHRSNHEWVYEVLSFTGEYYEVRCFGHQLITPYVQKDLLEKYTEFEKSYYRNIKLEQLGI